MFYNGGLNAGASQKHKHMQIIPYESFFKNSVPIESAIKSYQHDDPFFRLPLLSKVQHQIFDMSRTIGSFILSTSSSSDPSLLDDA
jgi:ATP adenylyltransferase/5',5'''-P-1,P-4-tetraphosphate phosphorylase II